jgi:hypothetical protein
MSQCSRLGAERREILTERPRQIGLDSVNHVFCWTAEMRILDLHVLEESVNICRVLAGRTRTLSIETLKLSAG